MKPDPLPTPEDVVAGNLDPAPGNLLIDDRLALADGPGRRVEHQVALGVDFESLCTLEAQRDAARIRGGAHDEVVLQLALVTVVHEVDARVEVLVVHPGVGRHIGPPARGIIADEIVGLAGQLLAPGHAYVGVGAEERHAERGPRRRPRLCQLCLRALPFPSLRVFPGDEDQDRLGRGEQERVLGTAGEKPHLRIGLASVGLEGQRQLAEGPDHPDPDSVIRLGRGARRLAWLRRCEVVDIRGKARERLQHSDRRNGEQRNDQNG